MDMSKEAPPRSETSLSLVDDNIALALIDGERRALNNEPVGSWFGLGLSPWQELELHFKIVACHASDLAYILRQRAFQTVKLQWRSDYFAWRMRCLSRMSLAMYQTIHGSGRKSNSFQDSKDFLATSAIVSLKNCIRNLQVFGSFCQAIQHQSGMDQTSWSMVDLGDCSDEELATGAEERSFDFMIHSAETCILNAAKLVSEAATGQKELYDKISYHTYVASIDFSVGVS
ncbi:uncharacterized protein LY89DRAFT_430856 [Mollisia scopiformis]|uniref:Uncharacterized protein n=1 Tax=Mollisia scopiformis TaxID=149040 RepID=A0A194XNC1_MOLSC|nr:uncharacterized protein LY89DRAFT_430856 [Mollisia scopiformis]KUJ21242.1 hypothetical protein LY89DRAFT_430856 [Mollisia scopiformis]